MTSRSSQPETAIVIGAGIGGLLAARALSPHFERVVIVERDSLPDSVEPRTGVAQSAQPHILLARGLQCIESLVTGFRAAVIEAGGIAQHTKDWRLILSGGALAPIDRELTTLGATRPLIEWVLRTRVLTAPNIEILTGLRVTGLEWEGVTGRVSGVHTIAQREGGHLEVRAASLVVDASGRGSSTADWLQDRSRAPVPEHLVTSDVGYSSCHFRRIPDHPAPNLLISARPPHNSGWGVLMAVEGGRWHLLLGGIAGTHPPTDLAEMVAWARGLAAPDIADVIQHAEPCSRPRGFRVPVARLRQFDRIGNWPAGLVVMGDAVAAFNPIYGQGMSVAALQAVALCELAGARVSGWERAFQQEARRIVDLPWTTGAGEDLRWPGVTLDGRPATRAQRMQSWFLDRVYASATADPIVSQATIETFNLLHDRPPFLTPRMAFRVLRSSYSAPAHATTPGISHVSTGSA